MTMRSVMGLVAIAAAVFVLGCEPAKTEGPKPPPDTAKTVAASDAGNQETCPVMGGKIVKDVYADHDGLRVYFCCKGCDATFKKDPEKYIKKLQDAGVTVAKAPSDDHKGHNH